MEAVTYPVSESDSRKFALVGLRLQGSAMALGAPIPPASVAVLPETKAIRRTIGTLLRRLPAGRRLDGVQRLLDPDATTPRKHAIGRGEHDARDDAGDERIALVGSGMPRTERPTPAG